MSKSRSERLASWRISPLTLVVSCMASSGGRSFVRTREGPKPPVPTNVFPGSHCEAARCQSRTLKSLYGAAPAMCSHACSWGTRVRVLGDDDSEFALVIELFGHGWILCRLTMSHLAVGIPVEHCRCVGTLACLLLMADVVDSDAEDLRGIGNHREEGQFGERNSVLVENRPRGRSTRRRRLLYAGSVRFRGPRCLGRRQCRRIRHPMCARLLH